MAQFICNFYSQHMDLPWIWNRTKKKNKARHKILLQK